MGQKLNPTLFLFIHHNLTPLPLYFYILTFSLPFVSIGAQEVNSPEDAILTYRKIILEDTAQLALFQGVFRRCVQDLEDEFGCVCLLNSIYLGFESRGQDWNAVLYQSGRDYPEITFIEEMHVKEIAAIINFNRLISTQLKKVIEPTSPYSIIKSSATIQLLDIMNLHSGDRVAVIQQDEDVIGELIATTGIDKEVVIYGPNRWQIESLFNLSPVSSEPSWKTPRYVYKEDLKISSQYNHDKILLNEVLQHNKSMKPMLRQMTSVLKMNDEVIVFEHIGDCCTHGSDCKEAKSSKDIERLFTSRSFRLIDKKEAGHYLLARFKYAPF
ncbi:MAG: hypothetical protein ACI974_000153 [Paraglaciecola sp.]